MLESGKPFEFHFEHALKKRNGDDYDRRRSRQVKYDTVCRHWLRNFCTKHDRCDYLHTYDPEKLPDCLNYAKFGQCTDSVCMFKHTEYSEIPVCERFQLGYCRLGPSCKKRHEKLRHQLLPEILPDWFIVSFIKTNVHLFPQLKSDIFQNGSLKGGPVLDITGENDESRDAYKLRQIYGFPLPLDEDNAKFFLVRSINLHNIQLSKYKNIWASSRDTTTLLAQAFKSSQPIILIFADAEYRVIRGYGRMLSAPCPNLEPGIWGEFNHRLGPSFRVVWIHECSYSYRLAEKILSRDSDVESADYFKDGTCIPFNTGLKICLKLSGLEEVPAGMSMLNLEKVGERVVYDWDENTGNWFVVPYHNEIPTRNYPEPETKKKHRDKKVKHSYPEYGSIPQYTSSVERYEYSYNRGPGYDPYQAPENYQKNVYETIQTQSYQQQASVRGVDQRTKSIYFDTDIRQPVSQSFTPQVRYPVTQKHEYHESVYRHRDYRKSEKRRKRKNSRDRERSGRRKKTKY